MKKLCLWCVLTGAALWGYPLVFANAVSCIAKWDTPHWIEGMNREQIGDLAMSRLACNTSMTNAQKKHGEEALGAENNSESYRVQRKIFEQILTILGVYFMCLEKDDASKPGELAIVHSVAYEAFLYFQLPEARNSCGLNRIRSWGDGRIHQIGDTEISSWTDGRVHQIGKMAIFSSNAGLVERIGELTVQRWADGKIHRIGKYNID